MRKILISRLVFLLVVFLMLNYCVLSGNSVASILTDSEKSLIKEFGYGGDYVMRWPDGYIDVYNGTSYNGMKKLLDKFNQITEGKVIFRLSDNEKESQIIFQSYANLKYAGDFKFYYSGYNFEKWLVQINNEYTRKDRLFLFMFTQIAGYNLKADKDKYRKGGIGWERFKIDQKIEKMLKALYKVPPGYILLTEKVK